MLIPFTKMAEQPEEQNCYLNRDKTSCVQVHLDKDDNIILLLLSTVLRMVPATGNEQPPRDHIGNLLQNNDFRRENRYFRLTYDTFVKEVLPIVINAHKLIKLGKTEHKVLLNQKKPDGLTAQIITSPNNRTCLDVR